MHIGLALYQKMYLIRRATEAIQREYSADQIKTPVHLSMGEEAIAAGVCQALAGKADFCGTYRNHGLYLSLTLETDKFFAELYGKKTGAAGGKAGSMHLTAKEAGLICTSAVVGTTIPVAVGAAFANKVRKNGKIVAVFFGDGALDEGVFWESFNLACVKRLPVIFVCEDNGLAPHTKKPERQGYDSIQAILRQFKGVTFFAGKTTDVEEIHRLARKALKVMNQYCCPVFMHFEYYRYLEHVGVNEDFDQGYRDKEEFHEWLQVDPIKLQRVRLCEMGPVSEVEEIEEAVESQIEKSITAAKAADFPEPGDLYKGVLA